MQLQVATRKKAKIRLGLSAVSGGGKTYSALLIAFGLCNDWAKIAIIDTENNSADLYSDFGPYNTLTLAAPFAPERYIEAIKTCEAAGIEVIIIDSITHEWDGAGGCLDIIEELTKKDPKHNSYTQWRFVTPRHQDFLDTILQSPCHIITTVRRKQDYEMSKGNDGKVTVTKAGLKEITREGFEYELTVNIELDQNHNATSSKDRTGLFQDKPSFVPSVNTGKIIKQWCEQGAEVAAKATSPSGNGLPPGWTTPKAEDPDFIEAWTKEIEASDTKHRLMHLYNSHKATVDADDRLKQLFKNRQLQFK